MSPKIRFTWLFFVLVLTMLACNISVQDNTRPTAISPADATRIMLDLQNTAIAAALPGRTEAIQQPVASSTPIVSIAATQIVPTDTPQPTATPTRDVQSLIQNAKILVYEDASSNYQLDPWVKLTLNKMGLKYVHVGDAIGDFMSNLNSSTQWDLIIVAAESRKGVQGEFWDVILPKVTDGKSALIVEMWYLSQIANGRIQSLTSKCGIAYERTRGFVDAIYTLDTTSPFFSNPNSGFSLTNFVGYWKDKGGDYVRLTGSGDAVLLAGGNASDKSRSGLVTSCIEGRAIIQTFSTHDYKREQMQMLWENYITNTLTNHFNVLP